MDEQVDTGRYKNANEVMQAGLRLLEQQAQEEEKKLTVLRKLANDGFQSLDQGKGSKVSSEKEMKEVIAKVGRRASVARPYGSRSAPSIRFLNR